MMIWDTTGGESDPRLDVLKLTTGTGAEKRGFDATVTSPYSGKKLSFAFAFKEHRDIRTRQERYHGHKSDVDRRSNSRKLDAG